MFGAAGGAVEVMLERARARGEAAPDLLEMFEIVRAPIYSRLLFFGPIHNPADYAARLVDRPAALAAARVRKSKSR